MLINKKEQLKNINKTHIFLGIIFVMSLLAFLLVSFLIYVYFYDISRFQSINRMPKILRDGINIIKDIPYLPYKLKSSSLPIYDLYIDDKDYKEINDILPKEMGEILTDEHKKEVSAKLVYNGLEKNIQVGYRGDRSTHWFYEKKSWGFKFKQDDLLDDIYSQIKLIVPHDRMYVGEYFNNYRAKKLNLPAPDDKFVILRVNNGPKMVYYQMEGWSREFLKNHFNTDDGNFYGENDTSDWAFDSSMYWKKYVSVSGEENNYADLDYLLDFIKNSSDNEFKEKIFNIIDEDNFYNWQIHSMLAGSIHQDGGNNMRLYFNKQQGKFYFIPWDAGIGIYTSVIATHGGGIVQDLDVNYHPLVTRILNIPEFLSERNQRLWDYIKDDDNLTEDLDFFDQAFNDIKTAVYNDRTNFYRDGATKAQVQNARSAIITNYNYFREQLAKAKVFSTVSLQSNSQVPIIIDFYYQSPSAIKFNNIYISTGTLLGANIFQLYEDTNNNNFFDAVDRKIADLKYKNQTLSLSGSDLIFYTDRIDGGRYRSVSLEMTKQKLFIVSSLPATIKDPDISFDIFNNITGEKITTEIHVNDLNPIFIK